MRDIPREAVDEEINGMGDTDLAMMKIQSEYLEYQEKRGLLTHTFSGFSAARNKASFLGGK